ncbi:AAA family ATPase [Levilactobacillus enshiensis]|uniref:AAA family ATPase n=1 Tax=Levilactobacillus enshiensis TaxID=2590213 RepID=UPI00117BC944|nr:AAA family ATPase [Levilactobacillus enshiensis]
MKKSKVIVVSGVTGSGKTTLVSALAQTLPDSAVISFDDYDIDALPSAPAIDTPVAEAVNQYDISLLMADFLRVYGQYATVIVDFPFGREHQRLAPYIDTVIYVKTPLDVCFARQLLRDYQQQSAQDILKWARTYLDFARPIFVDHEQVVGATADMIVDGTLTVSQEVAEVLTEVGDSLGNGSESGSI